MKNFILILGVISFFSCSGKEDSADNSGSDRMRVYESPSGRVDIPTEPERIVADYYTGELLKLEVPLVGADLTYMSSTWENQLEGVSDIGQSLEAVMALEPDLIITMHKNKLEQYRSIAPTVCIPYGFYNPEELLKELAAITVTEHVAEKWIEQFNANIDELAKLFPHKDRTYTIIDIWGNKAYLYGEHYGRGGYILYNKLGLKGTSDAERDYIRKPDSYLDLNIETLPLYSGDVLLVMSEKDPRVDGKDFMDTVIWEHLEAVKNHRVVYLNSHDFWFLDPFSLDLQVEILQEVFDEKN